MAPPAARSPPPGAPAPPTAIRSSPATPPANDVTAALFLLLRTQDITSEVFTCPSSNAEKWDFGGGVNTALNWSNWNGTTGITKNLSYSYQNPYPNNNAVASGWKLNTSISADFAVASDINPGTNTTGAGSAAQANGVDHPGFVLGSDPRGNSANHDRDGQNVLYGDGHVTFEQNPVRLGSGRQHLHPPHLCDPAEPGRSA